MRKEKSSLLIGIITVRITLNQSFKFALNRFAVPDEISGIVSFLVDSERASYVTGENYVIAGGSTSRL